MQGLCTSNCVLPNSSLLVISFSHFLFTIISKLIASMYLLIQTEGGSLSIFTHMTVISQIKWCVLTWYCFVNHVFLWLMFSHGTMWLFLNLYYFYSHPKQKLLSKASIKFLQKEIICNIFRVILKIIYIHDHTAAIWILVILYKVFCNYFVGLGTFINLNDF